MSDNRPGTELAYAAAMPAPQGGALPTSLEWQALHNMAETLAASDVIPYRLKRKPADVAVVLLAAREYGIPPLMALSKLPVVNGTPAPMGELMVALILRAGHSIRAAFRNPDGTTYKGGPLTREHYGEAVARRRDWTEGAEEALTFTLEEAVTAGLVTLTRDGKAEAFDDKGRPLPWMQYTPNMARWRAVANVARLYFPDVLLGLSYLPEELGAIVDAEGAPIVGEVVDEPRQRTAPGGTLEERSAQEAADRLATFVGPLEVLDKVLGHAEANGYADAPVTYKGDAMTLRGAIAVARADLADSTVAHDGPAQDAPEEAAQAAQEAPAPSPATEEAAEEAPAPQEADDAPGAELGTPATEYARAALEEADVEALRGLWHMAADAGALDANVIAVVGDDDLAALDLTRNPHVEAGELPLRGLLLTVNAYVGRHGIAVRDLGEPDGPAPASEGPDPWAQDEAQA